MYNISTAVYGVVSMSRLLENLFLLQIVSYKQQNIKHWYIIEKKNCIGILQIKTIDSLQLAN